MRPLSIFAAFLAVLLLGGPIMACVAQDASLSAEEKQCCKEMGSKCAPDAAGMPMPHSCCNTTVQPRNDYRGASTISAPLPSLVVTFLEPPAAFVSGNQFSEHALWLAQSHAPPREANHTSSPLRI